MTETIIIVFAKYFLSFYRLYIAGYNGGATILKMGGWGGVNALEGGGSIQGKHSNLKKGGMHDPPLSSYGAAPGWLARKYLAIAFANFFPRKNVVDRLF